MAIKKKKKGVKKSKVKKGVKRSPKKTSPKKKKMPSGVRSKMKKGLMKRLKEDQEARKAGGKGIFKPDTGVNFYSPEGGDHLIDIIPFIAGSNHPTVEEGEPAYNLRVKVHYGVGPNEDKSFLCLQETFNQPCPICEHRVSLRNDGADEDVWKALYPKKRAIYNVVCFDSSREEDKGVQIWEVSEFYFQKHLDTLAKGSRRPGRESSGALIPFTDPDEGKSIAFTINPPKSRNDFAEYIGHRFEERDYEIDDDLLEDAESLDELITIPEYDTVYEEYYGEAVEEDGDDDDDDDDDDREEESDEYDDDDEEVEDDDDEEVEDDDDDDDDDDEDSCPGGGEFGVDTNELEACDEDCDKWEECLAEQQARKKAKRKKALKSKKGKTAKSKKKKKK